MWPWSVSQTPGGRDAVTLTRSWPKTAKYRRGWPGPFCPTEKDKTPLNSRLHTSQKKRIFFFFFEEFQLKFCIVDSPKTQHTVSRQGRAVGIIAVFTPLKVKQTEREEPSLLHQPEPASRKKKTYQHNNGGDQSCGFKHALQLFEGSH